ncbi:MAG: PilN domain-containing protein [Phycisphaerales bacterium]
MSKNGRSNLGSSNTVLAIHRQGDAVRLLAARPDGQSISVKEASTLSAADAAGLTAAVARLRPDRVVHVIPAGQTIWRKLDAAPPGPDAQPAQIEAAMNLLAEASLPATVPTHRRAAAALRTPGGTATVACGWLGEWNQPELEVPEQWLPEPVALIAAARLLGRGPGLCVYGDRKDGVVTVAVVSGGEKPSATIRINREDAADPEHWREAVSGLASETAEAAGMPGQSVEPRANADFDILYPAATGSAPAINGVPAGDRRWHEQFDLALGAAATALTAMPGERPLLAMHAQAPEFVEPVYLRAASVLASPRKLAIVIAACLALVLVVPLAMAYARLSILQTKSTGAKADAENFTKAVDQAEWYQLLREKRWPMTRLLAELTTTAPESVLIDDVTIEQGKVVTVTATAESAEDVANWREALNKSKVFEDAKVPTIDSATTPVRFSLNAKVVAPMLALADAVPAIGTKIDVPAPEPLPVLTSSGSSRSNERTMERPSRNNRNNNSGNTAGSRSTNTSSTPAEKPAVVAEAPPAISEAQIAKLDRSAAVNEFAKRRAASKRPGISETDRKRLESEAEHLKARLDQLQGAGQ